MRHCWYSLSASGLDGNRDGTQSVVFAMKGGGRFPGKLQLSDGLCVRVEMGEAAIGGTRTIHRSTVFVSSWTSATNGCMGSRLIRGESFSSTR